MLSNGCGLMPRTLRHKWHTGQQVHTTRDVLSTDGAVKVPQGSVGIVVAHHRHGGQPVYLVDFGARGELVAGQDQITPDLALFDLGNREH